MYSRFKISKTVIESVCKGISTPINEEKIGAEYYDILKKAFVPNKDNPYFDGDVIKEWCFPQNDEKYDVFISHSYADYQDAFRLKNLIESRYGLSCFVDSQVWHNAYNLLKAIDDEFCYQKEFKTYHYKARNQSMAHVYAMLSIALLEMIDKTECCILLENSKTQINFKELKNDEYTISPWIYEEVAYMNHIKTTLNRETSLNESQQKSFSESFNIRHGIDTTGFIQLTESDFPKEMPSQWLDYLYTKKARLKFASKDFRDQYVLEIQK